MNLINMESVSKAYGPAALLDGVSLGVDDTDRIGVVGRNGDGKSTLVSMLARRVAVSEPMRFCTASSACRRIMRQV